MEAGRTKAKMEAGRVPVSTPKDDRSQSRGYLHWVDLVDLVLSELDVQSLYARFSDDEPANFSHKFVTCSTAEENGFQLYTITWKRGTSGCDTNKLLPLLTENKKKIIQRQELAPNPAPCVPRNNKSEVRARLSPLWCLRDASRCAWDESWAI